MASDINKMTRLLKLVSMLRKNSFPNHTTLERELRSLDVTGQFKISQKTIQRDVLYLQAEYNLDSRAHITRFHFGGSTPMAS